MNGSPKPTKTLSRNPEADLVFSQGGSGSVPLKSPVSENDYFIILDVEETQKLGQAGSRVHVRSLIPIQAEWLFDLSPSLLKESAELIWDKKLERVVQHSKISYGQLTLNESFEKPKDLQAAGKILLKEGLGLDLERGDLEIHKLLQACSRFTESEALEEILARIKLASKEPSLGFPSLEGEPFKNWVKEWFNNLTDLSEFKRENFNEKILSLLPHSSVQSLNQLLPNHLTLPKGRRVKIHYRFNKDPWIESRLQDFFGMKEGPKILRGKIPLALHLLAPNKRPVQVTTDLLSFWKNAYPQIRKELSRKYPRHAWPVDPFK